MLVESGLLPPPASAGGGTGTPRRVPVPPVRHVPSVLAARMAASRGDHASHGDSLFPELQRLRPRNPFLWDDFVGPLPWDAIRNQARLRPGAVPGLRWPEDFVQGLVRWARALAWMPGPAEVSWAKLAPDYEAFAGQGAPSLPKSRNVGYAPAAWGAGPNPEQCGRCGRAPLSGGHTAIPGPPWGGVALSSC